MLCNLAVCAKIVVNSIRGLSNEHRTKKRNGFSKARLFRPTNAAPLGSNPVALRASRRGRLRCYNGGPFSRRDTVAGGVALDSCCMVLVVAAVYATRLMLIRAFFRENPQGDSAISWERWFCLSSLVSAVIFAESGVDIVLEKPADISQLIETMTVLAMTRKESGE